ncbi:MAG: DUF4855 domain-containing protein, partial [Syntrophomonadaceae bacterium]|nr:DUF4855 domain-containing protein [Syntrophomonadaceae bacterium]
HLSLPLIALAENDFTSFWGLTRTGEVYLLELPKEKESRALDRIGVATPGRESFVPRQIKQIRLGRGKIHRLQKMIKLTKTDNYKSLAFDGQRFWVTSERVPNSGIFELSTYRQDGTGLRVLPRRPEVAPFSLSYIHNNLMVLDSVHQQLHYYHLTDNLEMVAPVKDNSDTQNKLRLTSRVHPGYLPAGSPASGGIHNLCLLYVGGVGKKEVHRYNPAKLRPLVSYIETNGEIKDFFMDGFLMLAQYSPLLNGRTYGLDLSGESSRQEDWEALFEEYFSPESNLSALDYSVNEAKQDLTASTYRVKVVLMLPTPSYQVRNWDGKGLSLVSPKNRIDVFRWAMQALIDRWKQAKFKNLDLVGFYYMTEQGVWDDPVLHAFPQLCRQFGYRSFAIPGITSSWMTEFTRVGFDCVSLQPSHAFAWNLFRPARYLLKYAGRIAREYGMGIEVELPYEVEKPGGRQKVYDYLEMAKIQGWAGAFKAYFQSYNLIKTLAESKIPEARKLYVELYRFSCLSRRLNQAVIKPSLTSDPYIFYQAQLPSDKRQRLFKINIEGNPGTVVLSRLQFKS